MFNTYNSNFQDNFHIPKDFMFSNPSSSFPINHNTFYIQNNIQNNNYMSFNNTEQNVENQEYQNNKENQENPCTKAAIFNVVNRNSFSKSNSQKKWSPFEDKKLISIVESFGSEKIRWLDISRHFFKSSLQCYSRWRQINPKLSKGKWSKDEDEKLIILVKEYGKKWALISRKMKNRSGKQVRDRYINYLDESNMKNRFSPEEDKKIMDLFKIHGAKWSAISKEFIGRSGDAIKNRYYWSIRPSIRKHKRPIFISKKVKHSFDYNENKNENCIEKNESRSNTSEYKNNCN